ncbi:MAG: zinc ribbon domain-containing protein [Burkholderiales bacterium]|nr:zinc ribbon domain-containing protein [Burkholderiales bacterium]
MPIYEYVCGDCENRFETLVRGGTRVECPSCHGTKLEKQLSVFSAGAKGEAAVAGDVPMGACGMCGDPRGPGACSL